MEILELLRALWLPKALAIIHCPEHQKADTPVARGNRLADLKAKEAALLVTQVLATTLPDPGAPTLPDSPNYTDADLYWIKRLPMTQCLRLVEGHRLQHHLARGTRTASPIQNASEYSHGNEEDGRPHTTCKDHY